MPIQNKDVADICFSSDGNKEKMAMQKEINMEKGDALLIIDVQNDFCPGGKLALEEGDKVVPIINEWVQKALDQGVPVCVSRDWHPGEHVSFQEEGGKWPVHCLQDSKGASFHRDLSLTRESVIITKGVRFDKDQNSAFDETGLEIYFKRKGIVRLFICGLALDVCVFSTAMDALKSGFQVCLILDGTRPVNHGDGAAAVEKMRQAGATVMGQYPAKKQEDKEGDSADEKVQKAVLPVCTKAPEWAEHGRLEDEDLPCDDGRTGKLDR